MTAPLREDRSKPGRVVVSFTSDRTRLDKLKLWVFVPESLGGTILSTEDVFAFLAEQFPPTRILLAGIEAGVWEDFPARTRLVKEIQNSDYEKMRAGIGGSASTDVTGGMKAKVEEMLALIQKNKGLTVQIFSAEESGQLRNALKGENVGTLLRE